MFLKFLNFFRSKTQPKLFEPEHIKKLRNRPKYVFDYRRVNLSVFIDTLRCNPFAFENENLELIVDKPAFHYTLNYALDKIALNLYFKPYEKYFKGVDLSHINAIKIEFNDSLSSRYFSECKLPKYVDFDFRNTKNMIGCLYMSKVQNVRIIGDLINGNDLNHTLWCIDFEERDKNDTFNFEFLVNFKESVKLRLKRDNFSNILVDYKCTSWNNYQKVNKFTNIDVKDIMPNSYYINITKEYPELLI